MTTQPLTSAVWDMIIPVSRLQAVESRRADQLIAVLAAKHNLTAHQKGTAASVTELWRPRVLTLHGLWNRHIRPHITSGVLYGQVKVFKSTYSKGNPFYSQKPIFLHNFVLISIRYFCYFHHRLSFIIIPYLKSAL